MVIEYLCPPVTTLHLNLTKDSNSQIAGQGRRTGDVVQCDQNIKPEVSASSLAPTKRI